MNDVINGGFEFISGLFCLINVFRLLKDKIVMGVSAIPTGFFSLWGIWNLYYYPTLNQWFSFIGGIFLVSINVWWLYLVFYYELKTEIKNDIRS